MYRYLAQKNTQENLVHKILNKQTVNICQELYLLTNTNKSFLLCSQCYQFVVHVIIFLKIGEDSFSITSYNLQYFFF